MRQNTTVFKLAPLALAFAALCCVMGAAAQAQDTPPQQTISAAPQNSAPDSSTSLPADEGSSYQGGSAPIRVMVGKSVLINSPVRLKRISVTDEKVADYVAISPTQILIHGRSAGEVSLLIWDELERSRSYDLRVDVDVTTAAEEEKRIFPTEQINVHPSRSAIVLSGHVSTEDISKRAALIAQAYSDKVVNALTFGPVGAQEVLLEVKFAEVDRSAVLQLGANLFAPGIGNTVAVSQTGQFGAVTVTTASPTTTTNPDGSTTSSTTATPPRVNISDFLNLFVARTDINVGAVIRALQQKNLLEILAEPNLIAVNGKEASFLAGGEFPFPVVQPGNGFTSVSIQFKEFGVRLRFTPEIMPSGNIHLKVVPEVSNLDFTNGLSISGFNIPALSTRRAETEFELQDGQSFAIAGLMDNRVTSLNSKVPWLGDIPIIGNFFKSKNVQKSKTELVVLCTVKKISPSNKQAGTPEIPVPFMDKEKFDGKKPADSNKY